MECALEYRPLFGNEIRLLKVENVKEVEDSTNTTPRRLIACSLEHVSLPPKARTLPNQQLEGKERKWPEIATQHDFAPLFKSGRDTRAEEEDHTALNDESTRNEAYLPWRHEWGDFIALSYVWSHPKREEGELPHTIIVDGCSFEVTPNLYYALEQLSKSYRIRQGFKLWVDAICINQADNDERGQQVTRMRDIYQSAWQVAIWLGPADRHTKLAFSALHWLARESKQPKPFDGFYRESFSLDLRPLIVIWPIYSTPMRKEVYTALFNLFTRPYWRRMWVVQEIVMGNRNTPVICGNECISWNDLHDAVRLIGEDEARFGREILGSVRPQVMSQWSFEIARDRVVQGRDWAPGRMWKVQQTIMSIQKHQKTDGSRRDWRMLVQALNLVRDSLVTEERDRVYGILGIKAVADSLVWDKKPNYNISLSELYIDFTSGFLAAGNLSILRQVSRYAGPRWTGDKTISDLPPILRGKQTAPLSLWAANSNRASSTAGTPCTHDIPSWTICWTCAPAPTAHLGGIYQADASLGQPAPVYPRGKTILEVKGVVVDTVVSLSSSHATEVDNLYPLNPDNPQASIYGSLADTREAFWKTIVGDTTEEGGTKAPDSFSWLLNHQLWQGGVAGVFTHDFAPHLFMRRNQSLRVCGYTLEELLLGTKKWLSRLRLAIGDGICNPTESERQALSWAVNAMAWRRLFGTKGGRMGMGTCAADVGDKIVILRGCNTPLILRESGEGWKLVGECFVQGVMYGEISLKEHELVDIRIY